ncbi:hypothetical protein OBBRIDRAFT_18556 [Obba rivulosa]|uniref:DUF6534 domain-containing protein n=1 Tax=Obba rivulosa TaxID=1052685 RepID=A0A8E2DVM0_9APHY|nr:hypothetical protein OBBRIDRAFT_18556 [Obba rivulosa]
MTATMSRPSDLADIVAPLLGPVMLGTVFSSIFFGITALQTYAWIIRCGATCCDSLHKLVVSDCELWTPAAGYRNTSITCLVQFFFARRVWTLSHKNAIIVTSIILFSVAQWGEHWTGLGSLVSITGISAASVACSAAADLLICASLCCSYHMNRTGLKRTDRVLNLLILYAVNTGLLTTIMALCTVVLEVSLLGTQWDTIPYFSLSKCYVNSVLATLNARTKIREMPWGFTTTEVGASTASSATIQAKRPGSTVCARLTGPDSLAVQCLCKSCAPR